jgi:hypothetical protein
MEEKGRGRGKNYHLEFQVVGMFVAKLWKVFCIFPVKFDRPSVEEERDEAYI